jgi:agmatine deiminase
MHASLQFGYIPYPLWRRKLPPLLRWAAPKLLRPVFPVDADCSPPRSPDALSAYLARWGLLAHGISRADAARTLAETSAAVELIPLDGKPETSADPIRLPAQWEPMESVMVSFPVLYPPLWLTHAQIIEAIAPVAAVTVIVPVSSWAPAVHYYLRMRGIARLQSVRFICIPTDDIWIRDYGPFVGHTVQGGRAAVNARFNPLGNYPQAQDDAAAALWAMSTGLPVLPFEFATEGGNYWSDGHGTLLASDELLARHRGLSLSQITRRLKEAFRFEKLIILPRLLQEETGHIDLVCKLVDAQTVLINRPNGTQNDSRLRTAAALLRSETNAQGQPYRVIELPFPRPYLNWGLFNIWRSYTNSLTVNGRVLVPIFGTADDLAALDIYRQALPEFEIVPIDCHIAVNGGGGVHCLTKEIPAAPA